jgi:hypothetical protein
MTPPATRPNATGEPYTAADIIAFISTQRGMPTTAVSEKSDLVDDCRLDGDDFEEFMGQFGTAFDVDLSSYLWYFHHGEEPHFGALFQIFFPAPDRRVTRIPISPKILLDSANAGHWVLEYPPHVLPKRRYDVIAAWVFLMAACLKLGWHFAR